LNKCILKASVDIGVHWGVQILYFQNIFDSACDEKKQSRKFLRKSNLNQILILSQPIFALSP
jgi:hypothetical protein